MLGWLRMSDADEQVFEVAGKVGLWPSSKPDGGWHYLIVKGRMAMEIRYAALGRTGGFGSIKVRALIGKTEWQTSLFPERDYGGWRSDARAYFACALPNAPEILSPAA